MLRGRNSHRGVSIAETRRECIRPTSLTCLKGNSLRRPSSEANISLREAILVRVPTVRRRPPRRPGAFSHLNRGTRRDVAREAKLRSAVDLLGVLRQHLEVLVVGTNAVALFADRFAQDVRVLQCGYRLGGLKARRRKRRGSSSLPTQMKNGCSPVASDS